MDRLERLEAIEAIKQCKARYWRAIDSKDFDLLATVMAEQVVFDTSLSTWDPIKGQHPLLPAKEEPSRSLTEVMGNARKIMGEGTQSAHMGHIPEISIESDRTASAYFPFEDRVLFKDFAAFNGYGYYKDKFEKIDGQWLIVKTKIYRYRLIVDSVD
ncbi:MULTISPECIES: nuclear transport factor 2 family protein [Aerococcus]|uniref:Nuclear transport factor 2 family protein n=1 Tax=Aerococcus sanguinicola TaxID=119206 RepID=A0A5N1GJN8_9LACT|nr:MULTISPECIES: nuclear transport factor 2 family protein [Aerococcus]KAA9300508.1 nuclear transport factor 2 family protein [Aerococcus sanguinicola]MDK6369676.1 nuclear transport factor 2 family protein [Aerococcus sp. UMB9870]MDK6680314.1 nuclear transport factor 2 family protein [Aerococcus sp. UMB8608]MDK6686894.1 nuclear transport factor 2 family protein [Aerococcus sp. UMB8623]OFK15006.1 hypothetical protein HMPREF2829_09230 [Aerococcus sp. HMSC072A12]